MFTPGNTLSCMACIIFKCFVHFMSSSIKKKRFTDNMFSYSYDGDLV